MAFWSKWFGAFGGVAGGAGIIGAFGACHTICQAAIAALAFFGITVIGMPLAFMQKPSFYLPFMAIGVLSIGLSIYLHFRMKKTCGVKSGTTKNKR